jgi:membrane protease YdiL (CAAX protease family)
VATLVVFLLGLALGWTRKRTNTTTTFFFHAIYNIAIGLIGHFVH